MENMGSRVGRWKGYCISEYDRVQSRIKSKFPIIRITMKIRDLFNRIIIASTVFFASCNADFLDTVPDNITSLEDVFTNKDMTERWLARIYSPIPGYVGSAVRCALDWAKR